MKRASKSMTTRECAHCHSQFEQITSQYRYCLRCRVERAEEIKTSGARRRKCGRCGQLFEPTRNKGTAKITFCDSCLKSHRAECDKIHREASKRRLAKRKCSACGTGVGKGIDKCVACRKKETIAAVLLHCDVCRKTFLPLWATVARRAGSSCARTAGKTGGAKRCA
jgi:hypothetical protein